MHNPDKVQSMTILGGYDINANNKEFSKAQRSENIKWIFKALFSMNSFRRYVSSISVSNQVEQARFYEMTSLFTRKSFAVMSGLGNIIKQRDNIPRNYPLLILSRDNDIELAKRMRKSLNFALTLIYLRMKSLFMCAFLCAFVLGCKHKPLPNYAVFTTTDVLTVANWQLIGLFAFDTLTQPTWETFRNENLVFEDKLRFVTGCAHVVTCLNSL